MRFPWVENVQLLERIKRRAVLNGINRFIRREKGTRTLAGASSLQRCCLALLFPAVCLALVFCFPSPAASSYFDTFGVDARGMALGNTIMLLAVLPS